MQNTSGISPTEYNVLVHRHEVETTTKGGIVLADTTLDRKQAMATKGTLIDVSPLAFTYERWPEGTRKPQIGDTVVITKAAGVDVEGEDGKTYRLLKDKDIAAVILPAHNTIAGLEADIAEANAEVSHV
ncbi:hypothetical protein [Hyphomonas sp. CY54-11-8]|uniref:hypothetical protein n=1 Tax=Hyphomonas sp. CY54-11-8 TaxID=1280944 RepID=UPI000458A1B9|nr:hypothetical protein [Hyphomonas sp. CY54-11-8]KCZ47769.1 hypothetical protein HY17_04650 [Hyphomonas sp. CY54-11-8]